MTRFYELSLETQIKRLRGTMIGGLLAGIAAACELLRYHHWRWASLVAIITVQVAIGSAIMMSDIKRDLKAKQESEN